MTASAAEFESGLQAVKAELDDLDRQIGTTHALADELKDFVKRYNELKLKEHELRKSRKTVLANLKLLSEFYQRITGTFPDGMYPLFSQPVAEEQQ